MNLTCLKCHHSAEVDTGDETDPTKLIYRCSECGSRCAYGELMPRLAVAPRDSKWIVLHVDGVRCKVDRDFAFDFARNILSLKR